MVLKQNSAFSKNQKLKFSLQTVNFDIWNLFPYERRNFATIIYEKKRKEDYKKADKIGKWKRAKSWEKLV